MIRIRFQIRIRVTFKTFPLSRKVNHYEHDNLYASCTHTPGFPFGTKFIDSFHACLSQQLHASNYAGLLSLLSLPMVASISAPLLMSVSVLYRVGAIVDVPFRSFILDWIFESAYPLMHRFFFFFQEYPRLNLRNDFKKIVQAMYFLHQNGSAPPPPPLAPSRSRPFIAEPILHHNETVCLALQMDESRFICWEHSLERA